MSDEDETMTPVEIAQAECDFRGDVIRDLELELTAARAHFWRACQRVAAKDFPGCERRYANVINNRAESIRVEIMAAVNKELNAKCKKCNDYGAVCTVCGLATQGTCQCADDVPEKDCECMKEPQP